MGLFNFSFFKKKLFKQEENYKAALSEVDKQLILINKFKKKLKEEIESGRYLSSQYNELNISEITDDLIASEFGSICIHRPESRFDNSWLWHLFFLSDYEDLARKKKNYMRKLKLINKLYSKYNFAHNIRDHFRAVIHFLFKYLTGGIGDEEDSLSNVKFKNIDLIINPFKYILPYEKNNYYQYQSCS